MFKLLPFLKPYKKQCILGPMFKLFEAILELLLPTIMALLINNGVATRNINYIYKMGGLMIIMAVLGFSSAMICQYFGSVASQGFGTNLRNTLFQHISSLSYAELDSFGTPSLINRITNDVNQLQVAVAMLIRLVVRAPFICIGAIIMAMLLDFRLSLILIATTPFFAVILYFFISRTTPLYKGYQKKLDRLSLIVRENLAGVRVIRAFAKIPFEAKRFDESNDDLTQTAIHVGKISALLNPLTSVIMNSAIMVLLWIGAIQINEGSLSAGTIVAFVNYITQILLALIVVSNLIILFTKASASAARVNELLETKSSLDNTPSLKVQQSDNGPQAIEFRDVSFTYSTESDMALENISVSFNKGETIGLIGGTGSGKSTFVNLIPRFYDVTKGSILFGNLDVKEYNMEELRDKIGIVLQKAELFSGTIAENLRWGNKTATLEELKTAAKIAQAHDFINALPDGYDTQVARGGANFSGGQKQRLSIARALVRKPVILILDDSSSALDFATDAALRKAIRENSKDITVIIVSQRVSTIKNADRILVFDDGHVVGAGKHDELMDTSEVYREICLSQLTAEEAAR